MPRRRNGQFSASIVGILNSNSTTDTEARANIMKVFIPLLCLTFIIDIGCALSAVYIQCDDSHYYDGNNGHGDESDENIGLNQCVWKEMKNAFQTKKSSQRNDDGVSDGLGDLLWLALIRCVLTSFLLWIGVRYGSIQNKRNDTEGVNNHNDNGDNENAYDNHMTTQCTVIRNGGGNQNGLTHNAEMTTPLLIDESTDIPNENRNGNVIENQVESQEKYNDHPHLAADDNRSMDANGQDSFLNGDDVTNNNNNSNNQRTKLHAYFHSLFCKVRVLYNYCRGDENEEGKNTAAENAKRAKHTTLILLFICSTFFQLYAGIKVALFHYPSKENHSSTINPAVLPLMCLSILWINIISYFFRVLLEELTREDALFLPPTVHRHPVFYQKSRGINLHWCDICRTRIVSSSESHGCYRCSLCDFDICMTCAKREDAATVGENLLRGDRGVRAEQVLDNKSYMSRSWVFVKPQLCLLCTSLFMLTCSSVTKLALPHFQGRIIDTVIPDADGNHSHEGFIRYIKIYVVVMIVQGAVSTIYSAIFTLISRRLKFTIRNSLFER